MVEHKHLIVKGEIKHAPQSDEIEYVEEWLKGFAKSQKMEIAAGPIARYVLDKGNRGMTACCLIKTSHIAFHIWDEKDPPLMQFDFYTCGKMNEKSVLDHIDRGFGLKKYERMMINRGGKWFSLENE